MMVEHRPHETMAVVEVALLVVVELVELVVELEEITVVEVVHPQTLQLLVLQ